MHPSTPFNVFPTLIYTIELILHRSGKTCKEAGYRLCWTAALCVHVWQCRW